MKNEKYKSKKNGLPAQALIIPFIAILAALHVLIIILIFRISDTSAELSAINRNYGQYKTEASNMLAGSSRLSESMASLLLRPVNSKGALNTTPISVFAAEYAMEERRGPVIASNFVTYGLGEEILTNIRNAASKADALATAELHALALFFAVYDMPDIPEVKALPLPELTEAEKAMTDSEKFSLACVIANGEQFASDKIALVNYINAASGALNAEAGARSAAQGRKIGTIQLMIRITTFTIIAIIILMLFILYHQLISPLYGIVHSIRTGSQANEKRGLRETRLISSAYNKLISRRANFEDFLRSTGGADIVASLPDRKAFEEYTSEPDTAPPDKSLSLILFDVSDYDTTEKNLGEAAASQLLRTSAECIVKCFGNEAGSNCFILDTSRFAAILTDIPRSGVDEFVEMFAQEQSKWGISIFWGVSYADEYGKRTLEDLIKESERQLYIQKKVMFSDL